MTQLKQTKKLITSAAAAAVLAGGSLVAGDYGKAVIDDKAPIEADPWTICDVFDHNTLYQGEGFIKEVSWHGRYHGQFISGDEEINGVTNNGYHEWHHRRVRLALEVEMANDLTFYAEANIADGTGNRTGLYQEGSPFFNDFQDLYITWEPTDDFFLKVGKQKQHLTREDIESSKRIKTIERSAIVNEVAGARPWGVVAGFETGELSHEIGAWIYGAQADSPQWIDTRANAGFSYNLEIPVSDTTTAFFDYVFVDNDGGNKRARGPAANGTSGSAYQHSLALGAEYESGRFQLITDFVYAANREAGGGIPARDDTWGFYVIPSYDITEKLEAVFRYAYMDQGREQRPQRFGDPIGGNFGNGRQSVENYHTFYAGLQYLICGEHLKVMGGYEYATGEVFGTNNDLDNGQWQLAVRTYF